MIREPIEIIDERHKKREMDYFFLRLRSVYNRVKYLSLLVAVYIVCEYKMVTLNGGRGKWWIFGIFYLIDVFFFYFNCYFVYPKAYEKRRTVYQPFLLILLSIAVYYGLSICAYIIPTKGISDFFENVSRPVLVNFAWRVGIVSAMSAIPFGFFTFIRVLKRERILENNVLYSRISPHLIFNSLNLIHSELLGISSKSDKMITCLSEYSRYAMAELAEDGKANLEAELAQFDILTEMMELRYGKIYLTFRINMAEPVYNYRIPPHLILTLAENLFKYGIITDPGKPGTIELFDQSRLLHVKMSNWKANNDDLISHNLGLANLRKRLKNIYDGFFTMKIEDNTHFFSVHIIIPL